MAPFASPSPHRGAAFARQRDTQILWLLDQHPVTAAMLVTLGWFPSKNKALKRLNRLVQRRRIKRVGTVWQGRGRPEHVFCRWLPKHDQLLHEVQLTQLCLGLHAERILRGPAVTDTAIRPDAEVWINGHCYYVELDRGTMGYGKIVQERFAKYRTCPHLSLWVCTSETRREGLRLRAEDLAATALFTTLPEALVSPHGEIWLDVAGERAALPRQGDKNPGKKPGEKGDLFAHPDAGDRLSQDMEAIPTATIPSSKK